MYLSYYTENKEYDKYDYYAYKLFELVANRDHDDVDVIKGLLVDIYDTAVERMKMKMWSSTKKYIELGWTICKSYIQLPSQLSEAYDAFKEAASQLGLL